MKFVILTGMSGAGKSTAIKMMEDIGFYCVDNIPPKLLPTFYDLCLHSTESLQKVAVVIDVRGGELFHSLMDELNALKKAKNNYKILFLDASDNILKRRYQETRRKHPLAASVEGSVERAIQREREQLMPIREVADYIIDSSFLSNAQMKERISSLFLEDGSQALIVNCMSFGFKYGSPAEADLVFDVRCLPNPFYIESLRHKTGLDKEVRDFVMESRDSQEFLNRILDFIDFSHPLYCNEGKSQLVVAIGCTGGKHRSVTFAELLYQHLLANGKRARINHRDIGKV